MEEPMIKIFDCVQPWPQKVNFIQDDPMVFVGYDMAQNCCEDYGFNLNIPAGDIKGDTVYGWVFDTSRPPESLMSDGSPHSEDYHEIVRFHLKPNQEWNGEEYSEGIGEASIDIYNIHNGYYSHGWEALGYPQKQRGAI
jgi:hypothetical protein